MRHGGSEIVTELEKIALKPRRISESVEQQTVMQWAAFSSGRYPELELLYHIPNEGKRSKAAAGRLKAEGLKKGVPDLCLPVARGEYHGLYIELKALDGKATREQVGWIGNLRQQGYYAEICAGSERAIRVIEDYLKQEAVK